MSPSNKPLRLLCFDGGGIRGLSSLYILKALMNALENKAGVTSPRPLRPCDYFDLIAGTSTGGLIAIMLGVLRMDIDACIHEYIDMAPRIFPVNDLTSSDRIGKFLPLVTGKQRFDSKPFEEAIKSLVIKYLGTRATKGEDTSLRFEASKDLEKPDCKVFVCVTSEKLGKPFRFRSYNSPQSISNDCSIWEACRATSAAPTFFSPMVIGSPPTAYVDGALGYNNPIRALVEEAMNIWQHEPEIACIVSIGTGVVAARDVGRRLKPLVESLKIMATDTARVAREFSHEMKHKYGVDQNVYFRFNVQQGLEHVGLEEWKEMDRTQLATQEYINEKWSELAACASQLQEVTARRETPVLNEELNRMNLKPYMDYKHPSGEVKENSTNAQRNWVSSFRLPFSLGNIPTTNRLVQRPELIKELRKCLLPISDPCRRKVCVIYGLGGIGKTQLAIEFARTEKDRFTAIFWLNGKTKESLTESLVSLLPRLFNDVDLQPQRKTDPASTINATAKDVLSWFSLEGNTDWLLVIDNCDQLSGEEGGHAVESFFPDADQGSIIITTRRSQLIELGQGVKVSKMNADQSLSILMSTSAETTSSEESKPITKPDDALTLVRKLDGLPLALVQAGRYIRRTGVSFKNYLQLYERSWQALTKKMPRLSEYSNRGIENTWTISFEEVQRKSEEASKLLQLWSYFDNQDIWFELIQNGQHINEGPPWFLRLVEDEMSFLAAVEMLLDYSLIESDSSMSSYSMHGVVHEWAKVLSKDCNTEYLRLAVSCIGFTTRLNREGNSWSLQRRLLPHATRVYSLGPDSWYACIPWDGLQCEMNTASGNDGQMNPSKLARVEHPLTRIGMLFFEQKQMEKAETVFRACLNQFEGRLGPNHPMIMRMHHRLGHAYMRLRKYDQAETEVQFALEGYTRILGDNDEWMLECFVTLSAIFSFQGKPKDAIIAAEKALNGYTMSSGVNTVSAMYAMDNLGIFYQDLGNWESSEEILLQSLKLKEERFGLHDLLTLDTAEILGAMYQACGRLEVATTMFRRVLEGRELIYGSKHEEVASAAEDLGTTLEDQGELENAETLYVRAEETLKRLFTESYKPLATVRLRVGRVCTSLKKYEKAERHLSLALAGFEKSSGLEAHDTMVAGFALGNLYYYQKRIPECEQIYKRSLLGWLNSQEFDDIYTVGNARWLARVYCADGKTAEAIPLYERALVGYETMLDVDGQEIIDTMIALEDAYLDQGMLDSAETLCAKTLADCLKVEPPNEELKRSAVEKMAIVYLRQLHKLPLHSEVDTHHDDDRSKDRKFYVAKLAKLSSTQASLSMTPIQALGKALLWAKDESNAIIAFEQAMISKDGSWEYGAASCDGCGSFPIPNHTKRLVCRSCIDIDICGDCLTQYRTKDISIPGCSDHEFLEIRLPDSGNVTASGPLEPEAKRVWLENISARYALPQGDLQTT